MYQSFRQGEITISPQSSGLKTYIIDHHIYTLKRIIVSL